MRVETPSGCVHAAAVAIALCCLIARPLVAQSASAWLPPGHWATHAATKLHSLGLAPAGFDAAARERTAGEIAVVLRHAWLTATARALAAAARDESAADDAARLRMVNGYVRRFSVEHPAAVERLFRGSTRSITYVRAELAAGFVFQAGALLAGGFDLERNWIEPRPQPDYSTAGGRIDLGGVWRDRIALTLHGAHEGSAGRIERLTLDAQVGVLTLWAGRRAAAYAPLSGGGLVLVGDVAFEGIGVRLAAPVELPLLGAITGETFVGKLEPNGFVEQPWLWGTRVLVQPHARFDVGVTRAAVFGPMADAALGLQQIAEVIIGANLGGEYADDQVASIDARWRPALGSLPLELYGEWGAHDIDLEVFIDVPAFGIGARIAALPFAPLLSVAAEHTQINRSRGENPPWYHHFELADGWTEDGVLLGHPLGGHGREWRVALGANLLDARLLIDAQAFRRTRGAENLFATARAGRSNGVAAHIDVQAGARFGIGVRGQYESGSSWTSHSLAALARLRL